MTSADTSALVLAAQRGDSRAMNELLDVLSPFVGRLCGPIALQDGADATQEALIAVFRDLSTLRNPDALYGWVRTIAVREAVRVARRARAQTADELLDVPRPDDPLLASDIHDVLDRLSPDHRAVLVLRDLENLDERSVAALIDVEVGTVKSRLHRARHTFRKAWQR